MGAGRSQALAREDTEALVLFLCWKAAVAAPLVSWSTKHRRGSYLARIPRLRPRGIVFVGPTTRDGLNAVIHEVAHHVVSARAPRLTLKEWRMTSRGRNAHDRFVHHGPVFVETLRELAAYWYGNPSLYAWDTEYRSLRAAGAPKED